MRDSTKHLLVLDAYSPTNLGDGELVRLTIGVVQERYPDAAVTVLATDAAAFRSGADDWGWVAEFAPRPLSRVGWRARQGWRRYRWLAREAVAAAYAILVCSSPLADVRKRRVLRGGGRLLRAEWLPVLAKCDVAVGVGGGYLGSRYRSSSLVTAFQYYVVTRLGADAETMPVSIASADDWLRRLLRVSTKHVQWRARDASTVEILRDCRLSVVLVPDLAWLNGADVGPEVERTGVVIAPVGSAFYGASASAAKPKAWEAVVQALDQIPEDEPLRLVAMHRFDERLSDGLDDEAVAALRSLIETERPERSVEIVQAATYADVRRVMRASRFAVAERLHAALAALTTATAVQVIEYEPKHRGVLTVAGLERLAVNTTPDPTLLASPELLATAAASQAAWVRAACVENRTVAEVS